MVEEKLTDAWNPEEISSQLKASHQSDVSHESVCQHIYAHKRTGGKLNKTLRCQKTQKKHCSGRQRRGTIPSQAL
jgi:IS30 family transposase